MEKLTPPQLNPKQLERLHHHLIRTGSSDALIGELLDHLACQVENQMATGLTFDAALQQVISEANAIAVKHLQETYQCELVMTEQQLQEASLDDIVFQFRNKAYGAYDLRQNYTKTLFNALLLTIGLMMMVVSFMSGLKAGKWSYLNVWGITWMVGLCIVAGTFGLWYHQRTQQKFFGSLRPDRE